MPPDLHLTGDADADALLSRDPLALLTGMLLDQQVPMERAFLAPAELARRLGTAELSAAALAAGDGEALVAVFCAPPALHRYPASMGRRVHALATALVEGWGGDPVALWADAPDGEELLRRLRALPGFGVQKAQIFVALLGKLMAVQPHGWREAAGEYGEEGVHRSVADVDGPESIAKVRVHKQAVKRAAQRAAAAKAADAGTAGSGADG